MKGIDLKGTKKSKYEHLAKLLGNQLHLNIRKNVSLVYDFQICFFCYQWYVCAVRSIFLNN